MTTTLATTALAFLMQGDQAARRAAATTEMTTGGWVFMIAAWVFILTLVYYTFSKVLRGAGK
jgi:hypothetical protein